MSIEIQAKRLAALYKKRTKLKNQLNETDEAITEQKNVLSELFKGIGLSSSFST